MIFSLGESSGMKGRVNVTNKKEKYLFIYVPDPFKHILDWDCLS